MSSVGICALLTRMGYAPVMQIACRDRNRIAIQGDVLGARGDGRRQHPLPDRRRRAGRRPAGRHAGLRPRLHLAARNRPHHARRRQVPVRPQDHLAAAPLPRRGGQSVRAALSISARCGSPRRSPPARSSCRRSTASTCRCSAPSCSGCAISASPRNASSWSASGRSPRPRRRAGSAPTCRASTFPTRSSRGSKARRTRSRKASSCIEIMQEVPGDRRRLRRPCHGLPAGGICRRDRRRIRRAGGPPALAARGAAATTSAVAERLDHILHDDTPSRQTAKTAHRRRQRIDRSLERNQITI